MGFFLFDSLARAIIRLPLTSACVMCLSFDLKRSPVTYDLLILHQRPCLPEYRLNQVSPRGGNCYSPHTKRAIDHSWKGISFVNEFARENFLIKKRFGGGGSRFERCG